LIRKIKKEQDNLDAENFVIDAYNKAEDKRIIILDNDYPWGETLMNYPEPLFVVLPKFNMWRVGTVSKEKNSFENRKSLPLAWAGFRDEELAKITGVADAVFCHNARFLAVAKSKDGAIALAKKARES
jgi:uncharacterized UPF0160 family protein